MLTLKTISFCLIACFLAYLGQKLNILSAYLKKATLGIFMRDELGSKLVSYKIG
jgi:hypothetical protein